MPTGLITCFVDIIVGILAAMLQRRYIALFPVSISFGGILLMQNALGLIPGSILMASVQEPQNWHRLGGHSVGAYLMLSLSCLVGLVMGWSSINAQQYVTGGFSSFPFSPS